MIQAAGHLVGLIYACIGVCVCLNKMQNNPRLDNVLAVVFTHFLHLVNPAEHFRLALKIVIQQKTFQSGKSSIHDPEQNHLNLD